MSKQITVVLDKRRHLFVDEAVIKAFESRCGDFREYLAESGNITLWGVVVLLWAMLQREEPGITLEQAAQLVKLNNCNEMFSAIEKCLVSWVRDLNK